MAGPFFYGAFPPVTICVIKKILVLIFERIYVIINTANLYIAGNAALCVKLCPAYVL